MIERHRASTEAAPLAALSQRRALPLSAARAVDAAWTVRKLEENSKKTLRKLLWPRVQADEASHRGQKSTQD